jgi:hypothetical protein
MPVRVLTTAFIEYERALPEVSWRAEEPRHEGTVSVTDRQGNTGRVERTFSVGGAGTDPH